MFGLKTFSKVNDRRADSNSSMQTDFEQLNKFFHQGDLQLKNKEAELVEVRRKLSDLNTELKDREVKFEMLQAKYTEELRCRSDVSKRITSIQHMYAALKERSALLEDSVSKVKADCESANNLNESQDLLLQSLTRKLFDIEDSATKREASYSEQLARLQSEVNKLMELRDKSNEECREKDLCLAEMKAELVLLRKERDDIVAKKCELESKYATLTEFEKQAKQNYQSLKFQYDALEVACRKLTEEKQILEGQCQSRSDEVLCKTQQIEQLNGSLQCNQGELSSVKEQLETNVKKFEEANASFAKQLQERDAYATQLAEQLRVEKYAVGDANKKLEEVPVLQRELEEKRQAYEKIEQRFVVITNRYEESRQSQSRTSDYLAKIGELAYFFASKIVEMEAQLLAADKKCETLTIELNNCNVTVEEQKRFLDRHKNEALAFEEQLAVAASSCKELELTVTSLTTDLREKGNALDDLRLACQSLETTLDEKERIVTEKLADIEKLNAEKNNLTLSLSTVEAAGKEIEARLSAEISALLSKLDASKQENVEIVQECEKVRDYNFRQETEVMRLQAQCRDSENDQKNAQAKIAELNKELDDQRSKYANLASELTSVRKALFEKERIYDSVCNAALEKERMYELAVTREAEMKQTIARLQEEVVLASRPTVSDKKKSPHKHHKSSHRDDSSKALAANQSALKKDHDGKKVNFDRTEQKISKPKLPNPSIPAQTEGPQKASGVKTNSIIATKEAREPQRQPIKVVNKSTKEQKSNNSALTTGKPTRRHLVVDFLSPESVAASSSAKQPLEPQHKRPRETVNPSSPANNTKGSKHSSRMESEKLKAATAFGTGTNADGKAAAVRHNVPVQRIVLPTVDTVPENYDPFAFMEDF